MRMDRFSVGKDGEVGIRGTIQVKEAVKKGQSEEKPMIFSWCGRRM